MQFLGERFGWCLCMRILICITVTNINISAFISITIDLIYIYHNHDVACPIDTNEMSKCQHESVTEQV